MKIAVIGTGYVGLVSGAVFAKWGHDVICVDQVEGKIRQLKNGVIPIFEPGLKELVQEVTSQGKLTFTTDTKSAVEASEIIFITVGTPAEERIRNQDRYFSRADLVYVSKVAQEIARHMNGPKIIVDKSTVPVRTGEKVQKVLAHYSKRDDFHVVSNPEFLREGCAVGDCLNPDRIVIGASSPVAFEKMRQLYKGFEDRIIETNIWSAELGKLAANGFLALSISYVNLLARFCDRTGADITEVSQIMRSDHRIGPRAFLTAGIGYGGSCFPKDVKSLYALFKDHGVDATFLRDIMVINDSQIEYFISRIRDEVWSIKDKTFAVLGLAFKENTDDVRESRSLELIKDLIRIGAEHIHVFDQHATDTARKELEQHSARDGIDYLSHLEFHTDLVSCYSNTDVLIVASEDPLFKSIDPARLKLAMTGGDSTKPSWVFEGRHTFDATVMLQNDFLFYSIGRPHN